MKYFDIFQMNLAFLHFVNLIGGKEDLEEHKTFWEFIDAEGPEAPTVFDHTLVKWAVPNATVPLLELLCSDHYHALVIAYCIKHGKQLPKR